MKNLRNLPVKAALCLAVPSVDFKVVILHTFPMAARDFLVPRLLRMETPKDFENSYLENYVISMSKTPLTLVVFQLLLKICLPLIYDMNQSSSTVISLMAALEWGRVSIHDPRICDRQFVTGYFLTDNLWPRQFANWQFLIITICEQLIPDHFLDYYENSSVL